MVPAAGPIPIGVVADDDVHSLRKVAPNTRNVVRLMCDEIARGVNRDVEEVGLLRVRGANGRGQQPAMHVDLGGVEVGVAARVADRPRLGDALLDEGDVEPRRQVVDEDAQRGGSDLRLAPALQLRGEVGGRRRGARRRQVGHDGMQRKQGEGGAQHDQRGR